MNTIALLPSDEIIELAEELKRRGFDFLDFEIKLSVKKLDLDPAYEEALAECGIVDEEAKRYLNGELDFPEVVCDKVDGWLMNIWERVGE